MIVFVRHGQTDAYRDGLLLGRADPSLNERGREQSAALATMLAGELKAGTPVLTSPLRRAVETADAIAAACAGTVECDARLIELDYGDWDQHRLLEMPQDVVVRWRRDPDFAPPNGESLREVRGRMADFVAPLLAPGSDDTVVAVSHVSPIKAAILVALDLDDTYSWRMRLDVASISRVAPGPSGPVLLSFNERV